MRVGTWRRGAIRACAAAVTAGVIGSAAACGAPPEPGPPLPTFPSSAVSSSSPHALDAGKVPDECDRMLSVADLGALFGLPLDTVIVRTTLGVPAPAVGRIERIDCAYSGTPGGPARGQVLLTINAAAYADGAAAAKQWRTNADAEDGDRRTLPIGAASGVLVERRTEALLTVVYGSGTLTFVLPARPLPGDRSRGDVLVDLALRVLPALAKAAPTVTPAVQPARAAGLDSGAGH